MSDKNCSNCGTVNSPAAAFCSNKACGQMLTGASPEGGNNYTPPQPAPQPYSQSTNEPQHRSQPMPQQVTPPHQYHQSQPTVQFNPDVVKDRAQNILGDSKMVSLIIRVLAAAVLIAGALPVITIRAGAFGESISQGIAPIDLVGFIIGTSEFLEFVDVGFWGLVVLVIWLTPLAAMGFVFVRSFKDAGTIHELKAAMYSGGAVAIVFVIVALISSRFASYFETAAGIAGAFGVSASIGLGGGFWLGILSSVALCAVSWYVLKPKNVSAS